MSGPRALLLVFWGGLLTFSAAVGIADTFVSGLISTNTTWTLSGSPYVVTGTVNVSGASAPVLTIQTGVTVKFNSGLELHVGSGAAGGLQAVGTSTQPIIFTANTASPPAGFWKGIRLASQAAASSQIKYATVRYGGITNSSGGIYIQGSSPTIQNVTCQNNAYAGLSASLIASSTPFAIRILHATR